MKETGLPSPFNRHHDVQAGLAHAPDLFLRARIDHLYHGIGVAVIGHALVETLEIITQAIRALAGEFDQQQAIGLPPW